MSKKFSDDLVSFKDKKPESYTEIIGLIDYGTKMKKYTNCFIDDLGHVFNMKNQKIEGTIILWRNSFKNK